MGMDDSKISSENIGEVALFTPRPRPNIKITLRVHGAALHQRSVPRLEVHHVSKETLHEYLVVVRQILKNTSEDDLKFAKWLVQQGEHYEFDLICDRIDALFDEELKQSSVDNAVTALNLYAHCAQYSASASAQ